MIAIAQFPKYTDPDDDEPPTPGCDLTLAIIAVTLILLALAR